MKYFILLSIFFLNFPAYAYIDPATGSAFFSLFITIVSFFVAIFYFIIDRFFLLKGFFCKKKSQTDIIIYSEGKKYWKLFLPILEELDKRKIKTTFYTSSIDDDCFSKKYENISCKYIGENNKAYAKLAFIRSSIVLMTTPGLNVYQLKRSKHVQCYVHVYHALADCCSYRLFGTDYYDTLLIANTENKKYVRELEKKRNLPEKELVVVGEVWMDQLKAEIDSFPKIQQDEKTVLLAPTWGKESLLSKFKEKLINELLLADYTVIIRPHPQMKIDDPQLLLMLEKQYKGNKNVIWDYNLSSIESMLKSSFLISDFSGIIFEYSFLLHRPVIIINKELNLEQYDASDLQYLTWRYTAWSKIGCCIGDNDIKNIPQILKEINTKDIKKSIVETSNQYWEYQGQAAKNIADYLENKLKDIKV